MKKLLAIFVVFLISAALGLMWRLGVTNPVPLALVELNEQNFIYLDHVGAYHKMNDTIVKVETELARSGFTCKLTFGHYVDSPESQEEDRLRSQGGCLVDSDSVLKGVKNSTLNLKAGQITPGRYIQAQFDGSPSVSPWTVYPKVKEFAGQKRVRLKEDFYEIYEIKGQRVSTTYLFKIVE